MDLLQLRYFCDAAESQNLSKTARKFFVPTSNISQTIKRLEKELGKELFEHKKNKIVLNEDGKRFYNNCSKAILMIDGAKEEIIDSKKEVSGNISLLLLGNKNIATRALKKFVEDYPKVKFIVRDQKDDAFDYDILISTQLDCEHEKKIILAEDKFAIMLSKNHPLANKPNLSVLDLKEQSFITANKENHQYKSTLSICLEEGFSPNIAIQIDGTEYLRNLVEIGLGVAIVPYSWRKVYSDKLIFVKIPHADRKIYAILPKNKIIKKSTRMFIEYLKEEAKNFPSITE